MPVKSGRVIDDFRIRVALPFIRNLLRNGNQVFIISHLDNQHGDAVSLEPVRRYLAFALKMPVRFLKGAIPTKPFLMRERVVLFDNIRFNAGEVGNSGSFAKKISEWGDVFINDAFSVSHRRHASVVRLSRYMPSSLGPLAQKEVASLRRLFKPRHPFLVVVGGNKFKTKEPLVKKFLHRADAVFVGGALANTFLAQRGVDVGASKVERISVPKNILWHKKVILPVDYVKKNGVIYDVGPQTISLLAVLAKKSKCILWNGTLGLCEKGYAAGSKEFAKAVGKSKAYRVAGGGDTAAAIHALKLEKNFDFISTAGGAMLEFLATGTLPGIDAIKKSAK